MYFVGPKLTEAMKFNLSRQITSQSELRNLATLGLRVQSFVIDTGLTNVGDINNSALNVIDDWDATKTDKRAAYNELCQILTDIGRAAFINVLVDKPLKRVN